MMEHSEFMIKPYTHQELATLYGVSWHTMKKWLTPFRYLLGAKVGHHYTTRQVRIIFDRLGWPPGPATETKAAA